MEPKVVISLFNGMSVGRMALDVINCPVARYYSSEIDPAALMVSKALYPDHVEVGDVVRFRKYLEAFDRNPVIADRLLRSSFVTADTKTLAMHCMDILCKPVDLLIGGSPCTGFSFAGKQLNFDDPRSALFFEFVKIRDLLVKRHPKLFFFLENVKMKKEYKDRISSLMGCQPYILNSARVSAQNRVRLYWTNIPVVGEPEDKGIILRDILEDEVPEKYFIKNPKFGFDAMSIAVKNNCLRTGGKSSQSNKHNYDIIKVDIKGNPKPNQNKASCFTAGAHSGENHSDMDLIVLGNLYENNPQGGRVYSPDGKSACLNGEAGGLGGKSGLYAVCGASRGRNPDNPKSRESGLETEQQIEIRDDEKTNCLTTVQKDNLVLLTKRQKINHKNEDEKANCFLSTSWKGSQANGMTLVGTTRIRRLTPVECERLQTVPDNSTLWGAVPLNHASQKRYAKSIHRGEAYIKGVLIYIKMKDSPRYMMLGNGWTRDAVAFFFSFMDSAVVESVKGSQLQATLFDLMS